MRRLPQIIALVALALLVAGAARAANGSGVRLHLPLVSIPDQFVLVSDRDSGSTIVEALADGSARRVLSGPTTNDSAPAPSPDGRFIAFFSTRDEHNAFYVMARDGSGQRKLADCNICLRVQWASDSRRLWLEEQLYVSSVFGPRNELVTYLLSIDGAPAQKLPAYCTALSRDGARCAYLELSEGGWKIVVRSPATAEPVTVASSAQLPMNLAWSPDGNTLLYSTESFHDYAVNIVGLDGQPPRKLAAGTAPQWSPAGDAIAFLEQGESYGADALKVIGADGQRELTLATGVYKLLGWSPDGTQLAFTDDFVTRQLFLVDRGGGQPLRVEGLAEVEGATWSPDSSQIAVTTSALGLSSVYTVRRDGSDLRPLGTGSAPVWTPDSASLLLADYVSVPLRLYLQAEGSAAVPIAYGTLPALAPGGRRLAFVRDGKLFTIGMDGRGERGLATALTVVARPAWSPDGRGIAVAAHAGGPEGIYAVDGETGTPRLLTDCDGASCGAPSWSPDGQTLLFVITDAPEGGYQQRERIFVVAADEGEPRELAIGGGPAWSPDGGQIAYIAGDIFVMGADGTGARKLTGCASDLDLSSCSGLAWSPDGRRLSFEYSGIIGGKAPFRETQVVAAESGEQLMSLPFHSARWWGQELAYLYSVTFGHYTYAHYDLSASYTKLAVPASFCCGPILPGHGNILDYDRAP